MREAGRGKIRRTDLRHSAHQTLNYTRRQCCAAPYGAGKVFERVFLTG